MAATPSGDPQDSIHDARSAPRPLASRSDSSPQPPATSITAQARTIVPKEPEHVYHAFESSKDEQAPIGNEDMIVELKVNGQLGVFYTRDVATRYPLALPMYADNYRTAIVRVLRQALERFLLLKDHIDSVDITTQVINHSETLANGIMICTYLKLRIINSLNPGLATIFHKKPKAPTSFEVPVPYALAISQLGQIRVSGLVDDRILTPSMLEADAKTFGIPTTQKWSPTNYGRAVEFAKRLGMRFSYADLNVKLGSTWWLFRPSDAEGRFTLECPIPEENFTTTMAALATLFCNDAYDEPNNPIFNLEALGGDSYGTMLRNPSDMIAVSTFFAVEGDPSVVWTIA